MTLKTQIIAWFPIKTWVKKLTFAVGVQGLMILAKKAWTYPTNDVTQKKTEIQNFPIFL